MYFYGYITTDWITTLEPPICIHMLIFARILCWFDELPPIAKGHDPGRWPLPLQWFPRGNRSQGRPTDVRCRRRRLEFLLILMLILMLISPAEMGFKHEKHLLKRRALLLANRSPSKNVGDADFFKQLFEEIHWCNLGDLGFRNTKNDGKTGRFPGFQWGPN